MRAYGLELVLFWPVWRFNLIFVKDETRFYMAELLEVQQKSITAERFSR